MEKDSTLIYLHGFLSSPQSAKARLVGAFLDAQFPDVNLHIPELSYQPRLAVEQVSRLIESCSKQNVGLIGSSLGGYYSLYCANQFGVPAVLINPALKPYLLLEDYLGLNENMYTGEVCILEKHHMHELLAYKIDSLEKPEEIYLLTQTGDETLDFQEALGVLPASQSWIQYGGNHEFTGFERVLPSILNFFQAKWLEN